MRLVNIVFTLLAGVRAAQSEEEPQSGGRSIILYMLCIKYSSSVSAD
jgi:hypothetical protein